MSTLAEVVLLTLFAATLVAAAGAVIRRVVDQGRPGPSV
jgi:hypothetical protein